jgi:hypothetical protein
MNLNRLNGILFILSIVAMVACPGIAPKLQGKPEGKSPESPQFLSLVRSNISNPKALFHTG